MMIFHVGQRWLSDTEPELGLGIITDATGKRITIDFPASNCSRQYMSHSAPIKRVIFAVGDSVQTVDGVKMNITKVHEKNNLYVYSDGVNTVFESELSDTLTFTTPDRKFTAGHFDDVALFNLRYEALQIQHTIKKNPHRGFIGGRISLIPHQLYVAKAVSELPVARALLSDEVGLGKTIEACLILHRMILTGKVKRTLIIVPQSLVYQWFVELLRKFNFFFKIVNEDWLDEQDDHEGLFMSDQNFICCQSFLENNPTMLKLIEESSWDMLIVDEAHHIDLESSFYTFINNLSKISNNVLLLTATPEQLGYENHFARLCLLDPERFTDFEEFKKNEEEYSAVSQILNKLIAKEELSSYDHELLKEHYHNDINDTTDIREFTSFLLDKFGTGRSIYRNVRAVIKGFPERVPHLHELEGDKESCELLNEELLHEIKGESFVPNFQKDVRVTWLRKTLLANSDRKYLLICRSMEKAVALHQIFQGNSALKCTLFHENMTLIQRDRAASWFAEPEGAQLLICSEIGSEGRNFQFVNDLILFDLPLNPELVEQRIGRVDRIGQKFDIAIHVPYVKDSLYSYIVRWYNDGIGLFSHNVSGLHQLKERFVPQLTQFCEERQDKQLESLIGETTDVCTEIEKILKEGKDRLLEINSFNKEQAEEIVIDLEDIDDEPTLEEFFISSAADYFGITVEEMGPRTYKLTFDTLRDETFPIPTGKEDGMMITFDRQTALSNEHIDFITEDNPFITALIELIISDEKGNCTAISTGAMKTKGIMVEGIFIAESISDVTLNINRFIAPTPLRFVVHHGGKNFTDRVPFDKIVEHSQQMGNTDLLQTPAVKSDMFPDIMAQCNELAQERTATLIDEALQRCKKHYDHEIKRARYLNDINPNITDEHITVLEKEKKLCEEVIRKVSTRLDSLRVIVSQ